jgi:hypothetical protein
MLVGLVQDLKIYVHDRPYVIMFILLHNSVIDISFSMLLGRPWFKDAILAHDYGNDIMTIQGNGMVKTIMVTKHLGVEVK